MPMLRLPLCSLVALALSINSVTPASAEIAVSANDAKVKLVDGKTQVVKDGVDTLTIIDLAANPPKAIAEINVPASVVGPPFSVAVTVREEIALVTRAIKNDPADPTKQVPDDTLTVVDLKGQQPTLMQNVTSRIRGKARPPAFQPAVIATLQAGKGAAGIAINKAGNLALVANRSEGTVSVFSIEGKTVTPVGEKVKVGGEKSGPSGIVFSADGKSALVTLDADHKIAVLSIDGTKVEYAKRDLSAGVRPYGIDISSKGDFAVVANIGAGSGDADTVSLIDMTLDPPRVVNTVTVGQTPEGIKISPDGNYVAVAIMNGTNKAKNSPFYNDNGKLVMLRRNGSQLTKSADADIGKWCQGIAWSANSRKVLVQCMVEEQVMAFSWNARQLQPTGTIKTAGGPAGIGTARK
jgi:DNA-binding beta-propeller fold protein YncE